MDDPTNGLVTRSSSFITAQRVLRSTDWHFVSREKPCSAPAGVSRWAAVAVVVCATCSEAATLPGPLRVASRLDCEVSLPLPGAAGRLGMLTAELAARGLASSPNDLKVPGILVANIGGR